MLNTEVRSAARVLELLEYLAGETEHLSLSELAGALDLPKSSTSMLLRTLVARGYVERDAADRYALNPVFAETGFGWGGSQLKRLTALAKPIMESLCAEVRETMILGTLTNGGRMRVLAKNVSPQELRYDADTTTLRPAYCTAMGRAMLAFIDTARRDRILDAEPMTKVTPETVVDRNALIKLLTATARRGYAVVEDEYVKGASGAAAPIFDLRGRVIAALDVASVSSRYAETRAAIIAAAVRGAAEITAQLDSKEPKPAARSPVPQAPARASVKAAAR